MSRFVMEAKQNYAGMDAEDAPEFCFTDQVYCGMSYDPVRRKIFYVLVSCPDEEVINDTGHTIYNGVTAIGAGAPYLATIGKNLSVLSIDMDAPFGVQVYDCYSPDELVPAGIGGGDGTWRRFTDTDAGWTTQGPKLIDPRTGDMWMHAFGADQACSIYYFRAATDYALEIFPLGPHGGSGHMTLRGLTEDWAYVTSLQSGETFLQISPRTIQPEEVTADFKLAFAEFAFPADTETAFYRTAVTPDASMWVFQSQRTGARDYKLYQFTPPSSAPYGGPTVGGGFTDVTPWGGGGPNTGAAAYTLNGSSYDVNLVFSLGAAGIACISKLYPECTGVGVHDPLLLRFDCTYVDGGSFDYHQGFVTGYMTRGWSPTDDPEMAAWVVRDVREVNALLDMHDFEMPLDYAERWMVFTVQPVVDGAWTLDNSTNRTVLVKYRFTSGAAPAVLQVIDEGGWDAAYTAYAAALSDPEVVEASLTPDFNLYEVFRDNLAWDAATNAFWSAGKVDGMVLLDPAYSGRSTASGKRSPPFLRLTWAERRPVMTSVRIGQARARIGGDGYPGGDGGPIGGGGGGDPDPGGGGGDPGGGGGDPGGGGGGDPGPGGGGGGGPVVGALRLAPSGTYNPTTRVWTGGTHARPTPVTRTTAMPVLHPIFLDYDVITGDQVLMFACRANSGIAYVDVWMNGSKVRLTDKIWAPRAPRAGGSVDEYGFAFTVGHAETLAAYGNCRVEVIAEGYANNVLMQKQTSDAVPLWIRDRAVDVVKTFGAGGDFATLGQALDYKAAHPTQFVELRCVASGRYDPQGSLELLAVYNHTPITAAPGVVCIIGDYSRNLTFPNIDGIRFCNVKLDTTGSANLTWFLAVNPASTGLMQFDGAELYTGDGGPLAASRGIVGSGMGLLQNGGQPNQYFIGHTAEGNLQARDVYAHDLSSYAYYQFRRVIGGSVTDVSGSQFENCKFVHGVAIRRGGGAVSGLTTFVDALHLTYGGAGTGSFEKLAANGSFTGLRLKVNGTLVTTATGDTMQAVADAINAFGSGWACTVDPASRLHPAYLSLTGYPRSAGITPAVALVAGAATLQEVVDIHSDTFVWYLSTFSNSLVELCEVDELVSSAPFSFDGSAIMRDCIIGDVAIRDTTSVHGGFDAQRGYLTGDFGHFGIEQVTVQGLDAGCFFAEEDLDAWCYVKNSYFQTLFWVHGQDPDLVFDGLVTHGVLPAGASSANRSKSLAAFSEASYISSTDSKPVTGGGLLLSSGAYAGAKVSTALTTDANKGWNL